MTRLNSFLFCVLCCSVIQYSLFAQEERLEIKAAYVLDGWRPFNTGASDLGQQGNVDLTSDLLLGKFGQARFHVLYNHGPSLSAQIGDAQVANNYEASKGFKIYEFWYEKKWKKGQLKLGQLDVNNSFAFTDTGSYFINSSFGIGPEITLNIPLSTFPLTSLGIVGAYALNEKLQFKLGLFDAYPGLDFSTSWKERLSFDQEEGTFFIAELEWSKKGKHKLGYWRNDSFGQQRTGYYLYGDLPLISAGENNQLALFYQFGWLNQINAVVKHYQGVGMVLKRLFTEQKDAFGIAYARANFSPFGRNNFTVNGTKSEQVLELNYTYDVSTYIKLQPSWQKIVHPALTNDFSSTSVFIFRLTFFGA